MQGVVALPIRADAPLWLLPGRSVDVRLRAAMHRGTAVFNGQCCLHYSGPARVRVDKTRWMVRRLLYAIGVEGGAERLANTLEVHPVCASPTCVEPAHLQLRTPLPPRARDAMARKKRERVEVAPTETIIERARKRVREMHEALERIERVRARYPAHMHDTEEVIEAERMAMLPPEEVERRQRLGIPLPSGEVVFGFI